MPTFFQDSSVRTAAELLDKLLKVMKLQHFENPGVRYCWTELVWGIEVVNYDLWALNLCDTGHYTT